MRQITRITAHGIAPFIFPIMVLTGTSLSASVLLLESFETDGDGSRYSVTGGFTDGSDDYFMRTDGFTEASGIPGFTGFGENYFFAAEDIDATENVSGVAYLDFSSINLSSFPAIQISLDMGAGSDSAFDSIDDYLLVQYRVDSGGWNTALAFQNNGQTFNGPLLQDTDFDGIGDTHKLGLTMQTISSAVIPVSGSFMDLRIDTLMTSGSEAVAFDNLQVVGVPEPNTTAMAFGLASLILILSRRFLPRRED
jgi:hypothetical protein